MTIVDSTRHCPALAALDGPMRWTRGRRLMRILAVLVTAAAANAGLASWAPAQAQAQSREYPIKAAFLFKFGEFVEWPAAAFEAPNAILNLCIVGDDAFAATVGAAVENETVAGRRVAARALARIAPSDGCHIAYLAGSPQQPVAEALRVLAGTPVLVVTDETRAPTPGIIDFLIRDNRVRFTIDDAAAAKNGLSLRSALLNIAVSVKRRD